MVRKSQAPKGVFNEYYPLTHLQGVCYSIGLNWEAEPGEVTTHTEKKWKSYIINAVSRAFAPATPQPDSQSSDTHCEACVLSLD